MSDVDRAAAIGRLQQELGLSDPWLPGVLHRFGLDESCAALVSWLPAIELAWLGGLTWREHQRLLTLITQRHATLPPRAARLLIAWLTHPPPVNLCRVARRTLRAQIDTVSAAERDALRARVIGPAVAVASVSGGAFGFGAISAAESAAIRQLSDYLMLAGQGIS